MTLFIISLCNFRKGITRHKNMKPKHQLLQWGWQTLQVATFSGLWIAFSPIRVADMAYSPVF